MTELSDRHDSHSCVLPVQHRLFILCVTAVIVITITIIFSAQTFAAAPTMAWNRTFCNESGSFDDVWIIAANDGYVIAGHYREGPMEDYLVIIKTDPDGNITWNRTYFGFTDISSIIEADDGYVITGITSKQWDYFGYAISKFAFLAKFDREGNMTWWKLCNWWTNHDVSIIPVSGGYVMAGSVGMHTVVMDLGAHLVKTDLGGNEIWNRTYGASKIGYSFNGDNKFYSVLGSSNDFVLGGQTRGYNSWINGTTWLMKTDPDGNEIWNRTYIKGYIESMVDADDSYVLLIKTSTGYDLMKTDTDGNEIWDRDLGGYQQLSIAAAPDGYVLAGGNDTPGNTNSPVFLMKTDTDGNLEWNTTFPMVGINYDSRVIFDRSACVIAGRYKANATAYNTSIFIVKTSPGDSWSSQNASATHSATPAPATDQVLTSATIVATALIVGKYDRVRRHE